MTSIKESEKSSDKNWLKPHILPAFWVKFPVSVYLKFPYFADCLSVQIQAKSMYG